MDFEENIFSCDHNTNKKIITSFIVKAYAKRPAREPRNKIYLLLCFEIMQGNINLCISFATYVVLISGDDDNAEKIILP